MNKTARATDKNTKTPATESDHVPWKQRTNRLLVIIGRASGILVILGLLLVTYAFFSTPASIRRPAFEHYHFRMQIISDSKAVNFAAAPFQEGYSKDNCSADLTRTPIHFHDKRDQMVHIHWDNVSGGVVLKYYGWNYIGGINGKLGYRFDNFPRLQKVPIHGKALPAPPKDAHFYVFTGDESGYTERNWQDFLDKDLETFFGKQSNLGAEETSLLDKIFPKASAHAGHEHDEPSSADSEQEKLQRINNLIGNVVIFAQPDRPSEADIKARFAKLAPLDNSTCGG